MEFPRSEPPPLNTNKELQIQITDWYIPESDKNRSKPENPEDAELYNIIIYGTTKKGITVSARVTGYEPYFYIKPPEEWENYSDNKFKNEVAIMKSKILEDKYPCMYNGNKYNRRITPCGYEKHLSSITMIKKKDFWGFTNNKEFKFIKVKVKSLMMYNNYKFYFDSLKNDGFKMYESNIDPFLRYIHEKNIKPSGWIGISDYLEEDEDKYITRCDYNIVVENQNIQALDINGFAPLLIASFDIECTSSHGDFPVAKKDYRKVAQDFAIAAKAGYAITDEFIMYWLKEILNGKDAVVDDDIIINRVYLKEPGKYKFSNYEKIIKERSKDIIKLLDEISNINDDDDDECDEEKVKPITVKQQNNLESQINEIFTKILPELEGDKIIQIGTTVHKYGSDNIIYKNIISLNSCNSIENVDVVQCDSEKQVIREWKELMVRLNPDIITGYNIFGFDMEYIWERANENNMKNELSKGLGRNISRECTLVKQELSSSALGENILRYFDMDGTVVIDLLKVMQRDHKLDSYKLDNVASVFIGDKKDDLKPCEIFQKFKGCAEDRCVIAKYCIQDCALVNRLIHKLKILENNIGMANVCLVPLNYLFKRGQGIKIFSLVAKQCMDKGYLIPVNKYGYGKEIDMDGYEGAVVLEPKEGIYLNEPIVVFDYGSLYPSSMIARNLSHDCYVMDEKYKIEDPNIYYITVSYDEYKGVGDKKEKTGVKNCTFAQYKDGRKGVIPDILCMLLQERKNTRTKIEYETIVTKDGKYSGSIVEKEDTVEVTDIDTNKKVAIKKSDIIKKHSTYNKFEQDVLDALQLAYKITANSLYGQIGARTSQIYLKDIAACTTATGREMIMIAKEYVEKNYNAEVIYGDSVMPYTPLTFKAGNTIRVSTFEEMSGEWIEYKNFKPNDNDRYDKEQIIPTDIEVWTHLGWSKVNRIIRHKTVKQIYRIITKSGIVDVTEDHSLLDRNVNIIKPVDCNKGTQLLHNKIQTEDINEDLQSDIAYLYGLFVAGGEIYESDGNYIWKIQSSSLKSLEKCKLIVDEYDNLKSEIDFVDGVYRLQYHTNNKMFIKLFDYCFTKNGNKIVPNIILNCSKDVKIVFKNAFDEIKPTYQFDMDKMSLVQSLYMLLNMIGGNYTFKSYADKIQIVEGEADNKIIDIQTLHDKYYGYVYDIETRSGVFHGGVGDLILKNTDSIFCKFPLIDKNKKEVYGKDALPYAIEVGKHVEKHIVTEMPKPQKLNYEKTLYPFILFSKKRYVGNLYEMDINKFKQKSMGIVLKRRDNAPIVKTIYGGIIDIILNKQDLKESLEFLREELTKLVDGKYPIEDLIVSKSLKSSYKDPTKIPHKVLADRIGARDPGNKPQVNDRIPYVYINVPNAKLQGDKIENPDYIKENNLTPDYLHYITNQIMNPVLQLYALCLEELPNYTEEVDYWVKIEEDLKKKPLYQNDVKRKNRMENLRLNKVKELLFDEFIYRLSEPKVKKVRKVAEPKVTKAKKTNAKITTGEEIEKQEKIEKEAKKAAIVAKKSTEKQSEEPKDIDALIADIKVTKKRDTKKIVSVAYINKNGKKDWKRENSDAQNKTREIISIIVEMINGYAIKENKKLLISINDAAFKKEYATSLKNYAALEMDAKNNKNNIQNIIDEGDIGEYRTSVQNVFEFERLIQLKEHFSIKK